MRPEDEYNETNKRHTMPHPPDHIPDLDTIPTKTRPPKEKKEKDKVCYKLCFHPPFYFMQFLFGMFSV